MTKINIRTSRGLYAQAAEFWINARLIRHGRRLVNPNTGETTGYAPLPIQEKQNRIRFMLDNFYWCPRIKSKLNELELLIAKEARTNEDSATKTGS